MIRRTLLLALAAALLVHVGYLYYEVGTGVSGDGWEAPSILYGRPTEIRKGDHLGNLHFAERLRRLSYKKVTGRPSTAGTYSEDQGKIRIFFRDTGTGKSSHQNGPADIVVRDGRVMSLVSATGAQLDSVRLEPEEIGRIMGPKMESRRPVPLSAISPFLQKAVIASEDARFYSHIGIDFIAIGRALVYQPQGSSVCSGRLYPYTTTGEELLPFPKEDPLAQTAGGGTGPLSRVAILEKTDLRDVP